MPKLVDNENAPKIPEGGTEEEAKARQKKRAENRPTQQTQLFTDDEVKPPEGGTEPTEEKGLLEGMMTDHTTSPTPKWKAPGATTDREYVDQLLAAAHDGDAEAQSVAYNSAGDLEDHFGIDPADLVFKSHWQNADLSLLPSGLLKQIRNKPQQADADYSLLPRGWQEGVVQ